MVVSLFAACDTSWLAGASYHDSCLFVFLFGWDSGVCVCVCVCVAGRHALLWRSKTLVAGPTALGGHVVPDVRPECGDLGRWAHGLQRTLANYHTILRGVVCRGLSSPRCVDGFEASRSSGRTLARVVVLKLPGCNLSV